MRGGKPAKFDQHGLPRQADAIGAGLQVERVERYRELLKYLPAIRRRVDAYPLGMDRLRRA